MSKNQKKYFITFLLCMLVLLLYTYNSVYGDRISDYMAKRAAIEYVEEKYKGEGFEFEDVVYEGKCEYFTARFVLKDDKNKSFVVFIDKLGKVTEDNYEYMQKHHFN